MRFLLLASIASLCLACETDPAPGDGGLPDAMTVTDASVEPPACEGLAATPPTPECTPLDTDYAPDADDMWAACVTDDGEYHRIQEDISTIARVAAFEELAALLFDPSVDPSAEDFLEGRLIYQRDEGLDSRVVRRYDPHFEVPDGTDCTLDGVPAMYPEYCVGPSTLAPMILDAFAAGIEGGRDTLPRVQAARVEAALLWFLYVSTYKESLTCTTTAKDCDSAYAYYTGGEPARGGIGLAGRVSEVDPEAHDRAWDGLLAVRCWRDLDPDTMATDLALRDRARAQYDRAVLDGVAAIVRSRLVQACEADDAALLYHWEVARTLGRALDREAEARDAAAAATLRDAFANPSPGAVDVAAAVDAIDALFDCP